MRTVEYLIAWDDHTWGTYVTVVPLDTDDREQLVAWAEANLQGTTRFRKAVMFALYHIDPEPLIVAEREFEADYADLVRNNVPMEDRP